VRDKEAKGLEERRRAERRATTFLSHLAPFIFALPAREAEEERLVHDGAGGVVYRAWGAKSPAPFSLLSCSTHVLQHAQSSFVGFLLALALFGRQKTGNARWGTRQYCYIYCNDIITLNNA